MWIGCARPAVRAHRGRTQPKHTGRLRETTLRIVRNLLSVLVILWGLTALTGRIVTPAISDYRAQIIAQLEQQFGVPIAIDGLRARWYGFTPMLELHGVRVGDAADRLAVDRVSIELALPALLRAEPLDALRITADGLQLTLVRESSGQLHLEGLGPIRADAGGADAPPLPRHLRLVNTRLVWIDRKVAKPPLAIDNISAVLDRDGEVLDLRASLETESGRATLAARVNGFLGTTRWDGDTYLKIDNLDVARLLTQYLPPHYGLHRLELDLESWGRWEDAVAVHHQGRLALRDLDIRPNAAGSQPLKIVHAVTDFSLQRPAAGGLHLGLKGLSLTMRGHRWPTGDLALAVSDASDQGTRVAAAADFLRIDDVIRVLQVRLPRPALERPLQQLQPRGEIHDLRLTAEIHEDTLNWRGRARFEGAATAPWDDIPGVDNLSGLVHGQQDHLVLDIDSRDSSMRFAGLFRDPLQLERLRGRLDLLRRAEGWQLLSEELVADTPHIRTRTRFDLGQRSGEPLLLDLQSDFRDGDAAFAKRYYPVAIMGPPLVRWLDRSVKSGRITSGTVLLRGPLDDYAFEKTRSGIFQVVFDTEDLVLDYDPGWPKLEQLDARVRFHGNQLDVMATSGSVYDSRVVDATAHIGSLKPTGPLHVTGRLDGPLANNLRVLREDALKGRFGAIATALRGTGQTRLDLDFTVPLTKRDRGAYALDGRLHLGDNILSLPDWDFSMTDVSGRLDFTLDGLSAQGITARAMGAPLVVDIASLADGTTRVRSRGRLGVEAIRSRIPALPAGLASGAADFTVDLEIPPRRAARKGATVLAVNSDLQGVQVPLPAPLGKSAAQARAFALRLPLGGQPAAGTLSYGEQLTAAFSSDGQRIDIALGGGTARLAPDPGIHIGGHLSRMDVLAWSEALAGLAPDGGAAGPPLNLDLQIDRLRAGASHIDELYVKARHADGRWHGAANAPNLAGTFSVPDALDRAPIQVDLERLSIALPVGGDDPDAPPAPDPAQGPDPANLPGLSLDIAELRVNQAYLGSLHCDAQRAPEGLRLTRLSLQGGELELDSAGHWSRSRDGFATHLGGRVSVGNLGDLLVNLGYSRQVEDAPGGIEFLLNWPGSPTQMHRTTVGGKVSVDVGAGRLAELDPGVTRVVGLLNLNALTRRLRLDFSDFYKKGYSFDSIKGDFRFGDGAATTDNLTVLGPSGRIVLDGSADLAARSLDQHVTVVPNFNATLPIAGTLAGGPIAGIAVLVAQQVMTDDIDRLNRFEYRVSGPWANPDIEQLDTGGTLSKILRPLGGGTPDHAAPAAPDEAPLAASPEPTAGVDAAERGTGAAGMPAVPAEPSESAAPAPPSSGDNPLRGLLDILKRGKSHGGDLPGTQE